jgi:hypothetical protein
MNSERTRLSGVAIDLIGSVASGLGSIFEPMLQIFFPSLLTLSGRTNKVITTRARACIIVIIEATQLSSILPFFLQSVKVKSTSLRLVVAEGTLACMNCFNPPDLEQDTRAREIEAVIRATARDANADIRKVSRKIFEAYKLLLPGRVDRYVVARRTTVFHSNGLFLLSFTAPLSPTMKKYLDIKTLNTRPQLTMARLTPTLEAKSTLSVSTSALSRAPAQTFQTQGLHSRSASSSALPADRRTKSEKSSKPVRHVSEKAAMSDMPPPQYVPVRPTQPPSSHVVSASRSTSTVDARKRTVSTLSPELTRTSNPNAPPGYPVRPASASSIRDAARRPEHQLKSQAGLQTVVVSGPRRIPLPEVSKEADLMKAPSTRAVPSTSEVQPTAKPSQSRTRPISTAQSDKVKYAARTVRGPGSGPSSVAGIGPVVVERPAKTRGVAQPTLSQLSRTKTPVDRKAPVTTVPKPLWGGRPVSKTGGMKATSTQSTSRKAPVTTVARPRSRPEGRSITPAQIPLPPSPLPAVVEVASNPRASTPSETLSSPPLAPLLAPMDLPLEDEQIGTTDPDENGGEILTKIDFAVVNKVPLPASTDRRATNILALSHHRSSVANELALPDDVKQPTTPRALLIAEDSLDAASTKTPISALLSSIQRGFLFTPSSPLSPPQSYLPHGPASEGMKDLTIPFPLHIDRPDSSGQSGIQGKKPFMFGVGGGGELNRYALGSMENLSIHK